MCGMINAEVVPYYMAVGEVMQDILCLVTSCPSGSILASQQVESYLSDSNTFRFTIFNPLFNRVCYNKRGRLSFSIRHLLQGPIYCSTSIKAAPYTRQLLLLNLSRYKGTYNELIAKMRFITNPFVSQEVEQQMLPSVWCGLPIPYSGYISWW